jgi:hypothetical protein
MALGNLVVRLGLDAAEFTAGLSKSERQAKQFRKNLDDSIGAARGAAAGIAAIGAAALGAYLVVDRLAKSAANFKDMEERAGGSAESFASLAVSAEVAGLSMEGLEATSIKISRALTGVDDESKAAGAALKAIGLEIESFKALDPAARFEALARALAQFEDGAGKTAVMEALVKGGAQLLPFLKELNAEGGRQVILTQAQIERADAYADAQTRAAATLRQYAQAAATEALPAVNALTGAFSATVRELVDVNGAQQRLIAGGGIEMWATAGARAVAFLASGVQIVGRLFEGTARTIAAGAAQIGALAEGEVRQAIQIGRELQADLRNLGSAPLFSQQLEAALQAQRNIAIGMAKISSGNEDRLDRMAKKLTLNFDGAQKKVGAVKTEVDDLARLLERLRGEDFAASIGLDPKTVDDLEKLAEASQKFGLSMQVQGRFIDQILDRDPVLRREQEALNAAMREGFETQARALQGADDYVQGLRDEAGAIGLTGEALAKYNVELARRAALAGLAQGDTFARDRVNQMFDEAAALAVSNAARTKAAEAAKRGVEAGKQIVATMQAELGAIGLTTSQLAAYNVNLERQAALLDVTDEAARARINAYYDEAAALAEVIIAQRQFADDARRVNEAFGSSFADNFAQFLDGSKSFKDAVKSMADDWVKAINRMASQKIAEALFGGQNSKGLFDFGSIFSGLFNGGGGGGGGFFSSLFGGFRADGGPVNAGTSYIVGERGPEVFVPKVAGTIAPNESLASRAGDGRQVSIVQHINVPANMNRQSASQLAAEIGIRTQRALARNT